MVELPRSRVPVAFGSKAWFIAVLTKLDKLVLAPLLEIGVHAAPV
jgi:hypothetical protein